MNTSKLQGLKALAERKRGKEMAKKTIYGFARHCMNDLEFNCGGIPTKEEAYIKALELGKVLPNGEVLSTEDLGKFYDAMITLRNLHIKYDD